MNVFLEARLQLRLSQQEMAERLGVTQGAVCHYEVGARFPRRRVLNAYKNVVPPPLSSRFAETLLNHP